MATLLDPSSEAHRIAIELANGRLLALDHADRSHYVGWSVFADAARGEWLYDVSVAEAIELAPDLRASILSATLEELAQNEAIALDFEPDAPVCAQSDRLARELTAAGVPAAVVADLRRKARGEPWLYTF